MAAIYLVEMPTGNRLIKAASKYAAINYAIKSAVTAKALTAAETVDHLAQGLSVEDATAQMNPEN
jgi:hypothetical protein